MNWQVNANKLSDWHVSELRRLLPKDNPDLVNRWIQHADIQCDTTAHLQHVPMPSENRKYVETQLRRIDKGIEGLRGLWAENHRFVYQRSIDDTKAPRSDELITLDNDVLNRSLELYLELYRFRRDLEAQVPQTNSTRGRRQADSIGLVRELADTYEQAGFGKRTSETFADVVRVCLNAAGLPSTDPTRSIKASG